ncbi:beta-L-arabinofuranosidase domain-containing protein [Micromonospora sp. NPDC048930]|uniref:beta-L-arabinofuranosidase domain-containing protein n=1 Tax=Micromonospora sp. NPDC048930 TaxID=3364261 RepID=UPI00371D1D48
MTFASTDRAARAELPLGAIRPTGWLLDQLRLQAAGQTGQLDEIWPDVGIDSAWLGGTGEDWERGPYYLDGLLPLAHLLDDPTLLAKAQKWIEAILASQRADGQFGPASNDDWWPRMVALKALTQHADATGDDRVVPFLQRYFRYQLDHLPGRPLASWGRMRGADNVLSILWLHRHTGEGWLIDLARLILDQTADWQAHLVGGLTPGPTRINSHLNHGPNVAMGLKTPAVHFLLDGDEAHRRGTVEALANLDRLHGQVHGTFSGDEWLAGRDPHHGVESCQVVEYLFTLEQIARIFGDGRYGDLLEQVAFNLLPALADPHMLAHQYHQQANQVLVSVAQRDWTFSGDDANVFGLEPHFGCCTANLHQGWPKLVRSLWMATRDGGLAAVAYAPCTVSAAIAGTTVRLDVQTSYPFEETIRITVAADEQVEFPLLLRVPAWCSRATATVNGAPVPLEIDGTGHATVRRRWSTADELVLTLPQEIRIVPRDRGAVGLQLGPLVLVHAVAEAWRPVPGAPGLAEWEITPRKSWNFGLRLGPGRDVSQLRVRRRPVGPVPFAVGAAPVEVRALGSRLPQWQLALNSAGPLPESPLASNLPIEEIRLLPYGSARLRVAELPVIEPARHVTGD